MSSGLRGPGDRHATARASDWPFGPSVGEPGHGVAAVSVTIYGVVGVQDANENLAIDGFGSTLEAEGLRYRTAPAGEAVPTVSQGVPIRRTSLRLLKTAAS